MLERLIDGYCRAIGYLIAAMFAVMVVLVFGNVVMRYAFIPGFTISEELSRWLFVWLTFSRCRGALRSNSHLGTDMPRWSSRPHRQANLHGHRARVDAVLPVASVQGSYEQTMINRTSTSAVMEVSMAWFYLAGMVMAVLGPLIVLSDLWRLFTGKLDEAHLVLMQESEETPHRPPRRPSRRRRTMTIAILWVHVCRDGVGCADCVFPLLCGAAPDVASGHVRRTNPRPERTGGGEQLPVAGRAFFMLAGEVMNAGGLSRRIVAFAMALVGHVKGGLGYVTIVAAVIMAALSGSAVADAAALTALLLPMMVAAGMIARARPD